MGYPCEACGTVINRRFIKSQITWVYFAQILVELTAEDPYYVIFNDQNRM